MVWKVTKQALEDRINSLEEECEEKTADAAGAERRFDDLTGRYTRLVNDIHITRKQCSRAERQVVRLLDQLEAMSQTNSEVKL